MADKKAKKPEKSIPQIWDIEALYPGVNLADAINDAEKEGAISEDEAKGLRRTADWIASEERSKENIRKQQEKAIAEEARRVEELRDLPKALEIFDEAFSSAPELLWNLSDGREERIEKRKEIYREAIDKVEKSFPYKVNLWLAVREHRPLKIHEYESTIERRGWGDGGRDNWRTPR